MKEAKEKPQMQPSDCNDNTNAKRKREEEEDGDLRETLRTKRKRPDSKQKSIVDRSKQFDKNTVEDTKRNKKGNKAQKLKKFNGAPFDYSKVDFTNFQGGSVQHKPTQVKSNFKNQVSYLVCCFRISELRKK